MSRQLGAAGTALIKGFEKLELTGYLDEGGIPTAGWGHTGTDVEAGQDYSMAQCEAWFHSDTAHAVAFCDANVRQSATQNQFDAIVSFAFNAGVGAEGHSTLLRLFNAGDVAGAAAQFGLWVHVNGQVSAGLVRRRDAEKTLFLTPAAA